ncbi:MAG: hypothetical protein NZL83_02055 [Candidatus Absconditabacterales bacterium]|nr:hypothetical protein [Candidatus Absconditabacterales bacterium]
MCLFCNFYRVIRHGTGKGTSTRRKCTGCPKTFSTWGKRNSYGPAFIAEVVHFYRRNGHKVKETRAKHPISSNTLIKLVKESGDVCPLCKEKGKG